MSGVDPLNVLGSSGVGLRRNSLVTRPCPLEAEHVPTGQNAVHGTSLDDFAWTIRAETGTSASCAVNCDRKEDGEQRIEITPRASGGVRSRDR